MTPIDEVEHLFRLLVDILSESDAEKLRSPIQVSELYQSIIPYRRHRAALGFDTNEDYEMAVLRFLAGEGGFVSIDPPEVQEALLEEATAVNPNPGSFREFAAAKVYLNSGAVRTVTEANEAYAPPPERDDDDQEARLDEVDEDDEVAEVEIAEEPVPEEDDDTPVAESDRTEVEAPETEVGTGEDLLGPTCRHCASDLPIDRDVNFCPYCGNDLTMISCSSCGTELELDWRFCITCGDPVAE